MITYERLVELLIYDPNTGIFTNRVTRGPRALAGNIAGSLDKNGYSRIKIDSVLYTSSRLAWLYCMQEWPNSLIDHKDGNRNNDTLDNLREATYLENARNSKRNNNSVSGCKGVVWNEISTKWIAQITLKNGLKRLGSFLTVEEASVVYEAAAKAAYGEFYRDNTK